MKRKIVSVLLALVTAIAVSACQAPANDLTVKEQTKESTVKQTEKESDKDTKNNKKDAKNEVNKKKDNDDKKKNEVKKESKKDQKDSSSNKISSNSSKSETSKSETSKSETSKSETPKPTPKPETPKPTPKPETPKPTPKPETPKPTPKPETPKPEEHVHNWVYHEATGHYDKVVDQPAWDEPVYEWHAICGGCGKDFGPGEAGADAAVEHIVMEFGDACENYHSEPVQTGTIHHEATYKDVWVQDSPAYHSCDSCGARK